MFSLGRIRLDEAIDDLVKYALMKRKSSPTSHVEGRSLWIHPLVQLWARETYGDGKSVILEREPLRLAQVRKEGAKKAICLVGIAVNVEDNTRGSSEWIFERENMAHLNLCYDEYIPNYVLEDDDIANEELAQVLRKLGVLKNYWSDYPLAADLILKSLRMYERLPHASRDTEVAILLAKQDLACVYINRDLLGCSIENIALLIDETVLGQRLLLGELHRDTLWSISLKASCLRIQGDLDGSVELYQQCIEKIQNALTEGDPVIMATTNDFAFLYETRREYDKALELYERSLDLYYKYRGENHQDTLIILDNIARFKYKMGDYEKSREYFQRLAKGCEETFGLANSLTLKAIEQLMEICLQMKQFDDALQATEQYLEGWKILYGKEHCRGRHILEEIGRQRMDSYAAERKNPSMELVESAKDIEMSEAGN